MDWAQLSLRQPCGWKAGISALPGKAAAEGSGGTAGMASGDRVLLPTQDAVLPVALTPPPQAHPDPARMSGWEGWERVPGTRGARKRPEGSPQAMPERAWTL